MCASAGVQQAQSMYCPIGRQMRPGEGQRGTHGTASLERRGIRERRAEPAINKCDRLYMQSLAIPSEIGVIAPRMEAARMKHKFSRKMRNDQLELQCMPTEHWSNKEYGTMTVSMVC